MKIPKTLKVAGHTYKVILPYKFRERDDLYGQCDFILQEIRISEYDGDGIVRPIESIEQTFIHELLHAVDYAYNAHKLEEEEQIGRLSEGIYQVLKDNRLIK